MEKVRVERPVNVNCQPPRGPLRIVPLRYVFDVCYFFLLQMLAYVKLGKKKKVGGGVSQVSWVVSVDALSNRCHPHQLT